MHVPASFEIDLSLLREEDARRERECAANLLVLTEPLPRRAPRVAPRPAERGVLELRGEDELTVYGDAHLVREGCDFVVVHVDQA